MQVQAYSGLLARLSIRLCRMQVVLVLHLVVLVDLATATACTSSCPVTKEGRINVHIIAHSHDDVGWLKTVSW